jgi:hypothetical protein
MFFRKWLILAGIAGLLALGGMGSVGKAGLLLPDGNVELEDDDFEALIAEVGTPNLKVEVGEFLIAIFQISKASVLNGPIDTIPNLTPTETLFTTYSPSTHTITGVTLLKVDSVTVSGNTATYTFAAPTPAEWTTHTGLTGIDSGVVAVAYDDPPSAPNPHIVNLPSIAAGIASATNGTRMWEFGFTGAPGEFWTATAIDLGSSPDPTDITKIDILQFFASLNVIDYNGARSLDQHRILGDPDVGGTNAGLFTHATHLQLQGNLQTGSPGAFHLPTDSNMYVSFTIPEPNSLAIWAVLAGCGSLVRVLRRRPAGS